MSEHAGWRSPGVLTADLRRVRPILAAALIAAVGALGPHPSSIRGADALQVVAVVGGQPDDITADAHGRLIWGDLAQGTVDRLDGTHVVTVASNISVPEGVVALPNGSLIVAAQGRDRLIRVGSSGKRSVVYALQPVAAQEGVDGIGWDAHGRRLLVPDSPNGTLLSMTGTGRKIRVLARGLGRPVAAAVDSHGDVFVPDEHLDTLVEVTPRGLVSYHGSLSTPDDVAVAGSGRIWITTLGDGGLWAVDPGGSPFRILGGLANPQGLTLDRCGDPVVVEQTTARIVRLLLTPSSSHCRF
jgi:sugar lactone lactonase YvrE